MNITRTLRRHIMLQSAGLAVAWMLVFAGCTVAQPVDSTLYRESPFTLHSGMGSIYGTLCTPAKTTRFPVALIIAGSGPTDRNGNSPIGLNTDCYKILAHRLAANGIASLRYDKRGIAESAAAMTSEADLRFDTYIADAKSWIDSLKHSGEFTSIAVIGHSEGSAIGMVAAQGANQFISIAGIGNRVDVVLKKQLTSMPNAAMRDTAYRIIDSLAEGHLVSHVPIKLNPLFRKSVQPYIISWMKYTPDEEIAKLKIPVLIVQGTNDIQVDTTEAELLSHGNPRARLVLIKNMNHIFRIVTGDRMENFQTYSNPDLPISDELVQAITDFIKQK